MKLIKRYEDKLNTLNMQKIVIEKEIKWVRELLDNLRKEKNKENRISDIKIEAETEEFSSLETAEATLRVLEEAYPNEMHQKEITRELFRRGWKCASKTPDQTVATALYRLLLKEDSNVVKIGKGKFKYHKEDELLGL